MGDSKVGEQILPLECMPLAIQTLDGDFPVESLVTASAFLNRFGGCWGIEASEQAIKKIGSLRKYLSVTNKAIPCSDVTKYMLGNERQGLSVRTKRSWMIFTNVESAFMEAVGNAWGILNFNQWDSRVVGKRYGGRKSSDLTAKGQQEIHRYSKKQGG